MEAEFTFSQSWPASAVRIGGWLATLCDIVEDEENHYREAEMSDAADREQLDNEWDYLRREEDLARMGVVMRKVFGDAYPDSYKVTDGDFYYWHRRPRQ